MLTELLQGYRRPAVIVTRDGAVVCCNPAAMRIIDDHSDGDDVTTSNDVSSDPGEWPRRVAFEADGLTLHLAVPEKTLDVTLPDLKHMPPRLAKIARLVVSGCTDEQIASQTGLSFATLRAPDLSPPRRAQPRRAGQRQPRRKVTSPTRHLAPRTGAEVGRVRPRGCRARPAYEPRKGRCAAARSPGLGPILSRFCLEPVSARDKSSNSASYSPLREHTHAITNVNSNGSLPKIPEPNWKHHNNFRSGDLSPADGTAAPDLKLKASVCQFQCLEQSLQLWVNLGNEGASALTAGATISVYGVKADIETLITELPFIDILDAGKFAEALGFQVDGTDYEFIRVRATANEEECMLDNNQLELESPFCSPPG